MTSQMAVSPRLLLENAADKLPSPNGVALAIMQIWDKEDTTLEQLARLIESDPALCGRLLRLANASVMGSRPVAAVPEAVVRVGLRTVAQVAVSFSLIDNSAQGPCEAFDYSAFWSQSLFMAVICKGLAEVTRLTPPDELFACGLLSRVGELALATIYPLEYGALLNDSRETLESRVSEQFGFNHSDLSHELMLEYGIPAALANPARFHNSGDDTGIDLQSRTGKLVTTFRLADRVSRLPEGFDIERDTLPEELDELCENLDLQHEQLLGVIDSATASWLGWTRLLDLPADRPAPPQPAAVELDPTEVELPEDCVQLPLRVVERPEYRAALVGDASHLEANAALLQNAGFDLRKCEDFEAARRMAVEFLPQLLLIDATCDVESAVQFCRLARATEWGRAAYISVVINSSGNRTELYDSGADSVCDARIDGEEFLARLEVAKRYLALQAQWQRDSAQLQKIANELAVSHHKFEQLSLTDQLTQLPNRRFAMQALERAWNLSVRSELPMTLLMIDLDRFKVINDQYGHAAGDEVLRESARVMNRAVRREECVCRVGGEEFLLVSSANALKPMLVAAERLRRTLAATTVRYGDHTIRPTMSIGVVQRERTDTDSDTLLSVADKALYLAKNSGRNRIAYRIGTEFSVLRRP